MASLNEMKLAKQQSNDHNPTTPPTPTVPIFPSVDTARKNQAQAENELEGLTPTTYATGTEDHHSEQAQGISDQVEASTTAMAKPVGSIYPQWQSLVGAVILAPLRWIITTPENYGADYGHDEGQSDSDSDFDSSDAGDEEQSDSDSGDGDDEQQSGSDSGDDDGEEEEQSDSDSGDAGGGEMSGSDSGDADDEKQSGSDSGDSDDEDEDQSDSDSGDDDEEEENEEEEAEEVKEEVDMDVDDETTATPPGVNTNDEGNNSSRPPGSIELTHRDAERSDSGMPDLTSDSSEEDNDGPNIRSPVTATSPGPENGDGESNDGGQAAEAASVLVNMRRGTGVTILELRPARTPASTTSDQSNVNSGQTQTVTPMGPEHAADENDVAVSSDVAFEEDALASSQEDEDMNSDSEEDEVSGTLNLRGGAGEPDMEALLSEEETELTDSESHLLPAEVPETPPRSTNSARETQGSGVTPTQEMEETASEPDMEASHGENETEVRGSEGRSLPAEIPETPPRTTNSKREAQEPAVTPNQDTEEAASEPDMGGSHGEEDTELTGSDGSAQNPETPSQPRGRHGEEPNDLDSDGGEAASSPEIPGSFVPSYQRSEGGSEDTQEPADPLEQDFDDDTSEDDWEADCIEADHFEFSEEIPDNPPRSAQRLGDDPADFDLDEGEDVPGAVDRVALLTGYRRSGPYDEDDQTDEYQGGESSSQPQQSKGKSKEINPNESPSSDDPLGTPDLTNEKTIHLRVQYLIACSKRAKASLCLEIPTDISYPVFTQTILNALEQHNGTPNPNPAHPDAEIARLLLFIAGRRRPIELTNDNLQGNLALVGQRSVYDYVKVEFVPETNGEVRRRKGTGKVNGRCGKVGGL